MPDPKEQIVEAFANQGDPQWKYAGVDDWTTTTLEEGTQIAQIEWRNPADADAPYSRYFTTVEEIEKLTGPDGRVDVGALSERLQVTAHGGEYNPYVSIYEVTEDMPVATARVSDNPVFGQGGAQQFFAPEDVKDGNFLEKIEQLETTNRTPRLPVFDDIKGLEAGEAADIIRDYNEEYIQALLQVDDPRALEVADAMIDRQEFSDTARDIQNSPEAIRTADIPNSGATLLDLPAETLREVETIRDAAIVSNAARTAEHDRAPDTPEPDRPRVPDTPESGPRVADTSTQPVSQAEHHKNMQPGTESLDSVNQRILDANEAGTLRGFAASPDGSTSYLLDSTDNRIYTVTDGQVSHISEFNDSRSAGQKFGGLMRGAALEYPDTFKGLPDVQNSISALGKHIDDLGRPAWRRAVSNLGDEAADLIGKGSKILGPLGVAAAGAEVYGLEMKLQDFADFKLVPEEAMLAYRGILTAHLAQATVDPSLVLGEGAVQLAHDEWAEAYGIPDDVKEALEPGSLLEDAADAATWLEAKAREVGMAARDYAVDVVNNPERILKDINAVGNKAMENLIVGRDWTEDLIERAGNALERRMDDPSILGDDIRDFGNGLKDAWKDFWGIEDDTALEKGLRGDTAGGVDVPIENIIQRMTADHAPVQDTIQARSDDLSLDFDTARLGKMLSQSGTFDLYPTLQTAGVESVTLAPHDVTQAVQRLDAALQAGAREIEARGLPIPDSQYLAEQDRTGIDNTIFETAASLPMMEATQTIQQDLQQQQQSLHAGIEAQQESAEVLI